MPEDALLSLRSTHADPQVDSSSVHLILRMGTGSAGGEMEMGVCAGVGKAN